MRTAPTSHSPGWNRPWARVLLLPLGYGIFWLAGRNPEFVERLYAERIYPTLARMTAWPGRLVSWSLGELLLLLVLLGLLFGLRGLLRALVAGTTGVGALLFRRVVGVIALAGALYLSFVLLWGMNYLRPPLARTLHWSMEKPTSFELRRLCEDLAADANALRTQLPSDERGVLRVDMASALDHRNEGYERLHRALAPVLIPTLDSYSRPKFAILSPLMSRSLTYGMYIPWTGEALLNRSTPQPSLPFTICHEMAHQQGIAHEDEANFVGYLACRAHPDPLFRYSGARAALTESMAQLRAVQPDAWKAIRATLGPGLLADDASERKWVLDHRGRFSEVQGQVYDGYLKAQGQPDGTRSYGRMVDLLIAERRLRER